MISLISSATTGGMKLARIILQCSRGKENASKFLDAANFHVASLAAGHRWIGPPPCIHFPGITFGVLNSCTSQLNRSYVVTHKREGRSANAPLLIPRRNEHGKNEEPKTPSNQGSKEGDVSEEYSAKRQGHSSEHWIKFPSGTVENPKNYRDEERCEQDSHEPKS